MVTREEHKVTCAPGGKYEITATLRAGNIGTGHKEDRTKSYLCTRRQGTATTRAGNTGTRHQGRTIGRSGQGRRQLCDITGNFDFGFTINLNEWIFLNKTIHYK